MPRAIAVGLALTALLASAGLIVAGSICGIESTTATCDATGCGAPVRDCTPYIDPLLWWGLGFSITIIGAVALGLHAPALALSVVAAGAAAYLRSPRMDAAAYLLLMLLLLPGMAVPHLAEWRKHLLSLAALIAAAVPLVMVPLVHDLMPQPSWGKLPAPPDGILQVVAFLPMALWLILAAWDVLQPRTRPLSPA